VKCVWNYECAASDRDGRPERIVPDGNPELIVHYGHPFSELSPEHGKRIQPRVFLMGQMTRPLALDSNHGVAGVVGVRFRPAGVRAMIGTPMNELTDDLLSFADVSPAGAERIVDRIACAPHAAARATLIQDFVAECAVANARFQDNDVAQWTAQLAAANGRISIRTLADDAGLSPRQLERRFLTQVGIAPQRYANVVRFRSVFDLLTGTTRPDWAALAQGAGYYDQSHMIRDFKRFLGCSPTAFLTQLRGLSAVLVGQDEETPCRVVTRRERAR
jgi:AraC-like DNA-binding protein